MTDYLEALSPSLFRFRDTCVVYLLKHEDQAVLIDFGSGRILDFLNQIGIRHVSAILMTHHHRDQGQGLPRAVRAGIPVWVPHTEQDLFHRVDEHWLRREIFNNYNPRQDRFSLLSSIPVAGTLMDYGHYHFAGFEMTILPTPGHTPGSISIWVEVDGKPVAFTGDLIFAPGKLWSLSATQWTYNGAEGVPATIASLLDLKERCPAVLYPSHGDPILNPAGAVDQVVERLWALLRARGENPRLFLLRENPYQPITPHLLEHRASLAKTYVLLSETKKALFFDFGYDFVTGLPAGSDRASRRPWLYTIPVLKRQFGIQTIDVVIPTHPHDDHVAGINVLRAVEGTRVWGAENFADVLENPAAHNLPCLWYDPIPVDQRIPLEQPIPWEEYSITLYPLPGHTRYAVAIAFEVDGYRVLVTGDQYQGDDGAKWNYVYMGEYRIGDYTTSAHLYRRLRPDLILPGHWQPLWVTPQYLDGLVERAEWLENLQKDLLPAPEEWSPEGFRVSIHPYQIEAWAGDSIPVDVEIIPSFEPVEVTLRLVVPEGWKVIEEIQTVQVRDQEHIRFQVVLPEALNVYRERIAVDLTVDGKPLGQQAEAFITVKPKIS